MLWGLFAWNVLLDLLADALVTWVQIRFKPAHVAEQASFIKTFVSLTELCQHRYIGCHEVAPAPPKEDIGREGRFLMSLLPSVFMAWQLVPTWARIVAQLYLDEN